MCVNSVLSASDLAWLEAALEGAGLLQHAASLHLSCIDADFAGALQKVCFPGPPLLPAPFLPFSPVLAAKMALRTDLCA